jgi:hypothetical protein
MSNVAVRRHRPGARFSLKSASAVVSMEFRSWETDTLRTGKATALLL